MASLPARTAPRSLVAERNRMIILVAGVAWAAAFIHGAVITVHLREYWLFGAFFVIAAILQAGWGAWIYEDPLPNRLRLGAVGNLAVVMVWAVSRTVGLPFGPDAWRPEAVGYVDFMATLDELGIAFMVCALLARPRWFDGVARRQAWESFALTLMVLSVLGALTGVHHH
jgi:hypothetical protein